MQENPSTLSWDASSEIVYYITKDVFENIEEINYVLIPKEKTEESLPLIQGFAVHPIEERYEWKTILIALLTIVLASILFVYRNNAWRISRKLIEKRNKLKSPLYNSVRKKDREVYKEGKKKITLEKLYNRLEDSSTGKTDDTDINKEDKEEAAENKDIQSDVNENTGREEKEVIEKEKPAKTEEKPQPKEGIKDEEKEEAESEDFEKSEKDYASAHSLQKFRLIQAIGKNREYRKQRQVMLESLKENFKRAYGDSGIGNYNRQKYRPKRRYQLILERFKKKIHSKK
jgi:hypothetical protein